MWLAISALLALVSGCASIPPPTSAMHSAKAGIQAAEQAGAADADPVDLDFARSKFTQAQAVMQTGKYGPAGDLANESIADSRLALTKARLAKVRSLIGKQTRENQRLRKQLTAPPPVPAEPSSSPDVQELPQTVLPAPAEPASTPAPAGTTPTPGQAMQEGR
jgi:hypothetical protein